MVKESKKKGALARKIIDSLSEEQCKSIYNQQSVKIDALHENLVQQFFHNESHEKDEEGNFCISSAQSSELRWHAITYLNTLEYILVAWQYSVVDKSIIEVQFRYLFDPASGLSVLNHFRKATGGTKTYPAIENFYKHLCDTENSALQVRNPVA